MNSIMKRGLATSMALAMAVSMGLAVSAKPQSLKGVDVSTLPKPTTTNAATGEVVEGNTGSTGDTATTPAVAAAIQKSTAGDHKVKVTGKTIQFIKGNKTSASYDAKLPTNAKAPDINVVINADGSMCLNFKKANGAVSNVSLGQQANVVLEGTINTLTIDTSVVGARSFAVTGTVTTLNVNGPVAVAVEKTANVNSLKVGNSNALVVVASGAKVGAAAASNASTVTGLSNIGSMAEVTTSLLGTTGNSSTNGSAPGTFLTNGGLRVEMETVATPKYTDSISFQPGNVVIISPVKNATYENIVKDLKIVVKHNETNNTLPGEWKFTSDVKDVDTKALPGSYRYQFTPYQVYKGFDIIVQIPGAGSSASTAVSTTPKISFYSGVGRGTSGPVDVDVTIPAGVKKGDTLKIFVGSDSKSYTLVASNAGETMTYTINIPSSLSQNAKVKVYCTLTSGGKTLTSNSITYTYNEQGDTKTVKKPGLSLSSSHGNGEFTAQITLPASVSSGDEIVVTGSRSGSSKELNSKNLTSSDAGKTISLVCVANGGPDDEVKIRATLRSGGTSISSDTKTYVVEE